MLPTMHGYKHYFITVTDQISGLLPDSVCNCCVTAHTLINLPILKLSMCHSVSPSELKEYQFVVIVLGTGL